ncbi:MAG: hypothetical protein HDS27_00305 [Bacteroides sp.]|nr:hypothetical protein [Bacteroides sp.]
MEQDDSDRYRRLDPDDRHGFLMQLAVDHLTNQNAQDIVGRIDQQATQKTGGTFSPSPSEELHTGDHHNYITYPFC